MSKDYQPPATTTDAGTPVGSDEHSLTVAGGGPVLLQDAYLNEKLAHFVRERVPNRVYHVKGADHLVTNIVAHLGDRVERFIQERAVSDYWSKVDPDLGARLALGLGLRAPQPTRR